MTALEMLKLRGERIGNTGRAPRGVASCYCSQCSSRTSMTNGPSDGQPCVQRGWPLTPNSQDGYHRAGDFGGELLLRPLGIGQRLAPSRGDVRECRGGLDSPLGAHSYRPRCIRDFAVGQSLYQSGLTHVRGGVYLDCAGCGEPFRLCSRPARHKPSFQVRLSDTDARLHPSRCAGDSRHNTPSSGIVGCGRPVLEQTARRIQSMPACSRPYHRLPQVQLP